MSMQHHKPDQAVLADSWMLFCAECSQKMRIIMAAPTHDGRETRTYECVYGHRERLTFDGQAVRFYDRGVSKRRFLCFAPCIDEGIHVEL